MNINLRFMATSTDFKKLYERYQTEAAPNGLSIVRYCQMNGVVYSQFEKWFKKYMSGKAMPVRLVDKDGLMETSMSSGEPEDVPLKERDYAPSTQSQSAIAHLNIVFSNGLRVDHHHISYQTLKQLVEKLEALC